MERRVLPATRSPPGFEAQIVLSIAPQQPTAPQEVRSQLIDPDTHEEVGHISITIDGQTLDQGPMHRPAIVSAYLEEDYQGRGLSPYLVYNLCRYLIDEHNREFPESAEQYSQATHICVEIDASDGYWPEMGGRQDYHPLCELVLTVGEMLAWAEAKLRKAADRKKSASKMRTTRITRRGTPYGGGRKRKTKTRTKKNRRRHRSHSRRSRRR